MSEYCRTIETMNLILVLVLSASCAFAVITDMILYERQLQREQDYNRLLHEMYVQTYLDEVSAVGEPLSEPIMSFRAWQDSTGWVEK